MDWYRVGRKRQIAVRYLKSLRGLLSRCPDLKRGLLRCCHCGIFLLSRRCNEGRKDIRCPLGCREHHKAMGSKRRSNDYYSSDSGRKKKRDHNIARKRPVVDEVSPPSSPSDAPSAPLSAQTQPPTEAVFKDSVVEYTRLIISMTERRKVSRKEALAALRRAVSQHSLDSPTTDDSPQRPR